MKLKQPPLEPIERNIFGRLSHLLFAGWDRVRKAWLRWAHLNQEKAWFPVFVGTIVGIDAFVVFLPGDVLVALSVLSNPAKWRRLAFMAGLGGAIGAFVLYLTVAHYGKSTLDHLGDLGAPAEMQDSAGLKPVPQEELDADSDDGSDDGSLAEVVQTQPPKWDKARAFFARFGLFSLALGSLLPFLSWPPVILAGLSTDRWWEVLFWLLLGRQARYWLGCFGLREGWAMFQAMREEAQTHRRQQEETLESKPHPGGKAKRPKH